VRPSARARPTRGNLRGTDGGHPFTGSCWILSVHSTGRGPTAGRCDARSPRKSESLDHTGSRKGPPAGGAHCPQNLQCGVAITALGDLEGLPRIQRRGLTCKLQSGLRQPIATLSVPARGDGVLV